MLQHSLCKMPRSLKLAGIIFSIGLSFSTMAQVNENLSVVDTVCEYQHDPVGIDVVQPRFSWKLSSPGSSILQSHYEIRVATSTQALETGKGLAWNSGRVKSGQSQLVAYQGSPLESKKRYYWKVRVWDNQGGVSSWSGDSFWEMGLLKPSDWQASWIALPQKTNGEIGAPPMFRKTFTVSKPVKAARLYITSYGIYEASLNASRVSRDYFRPGWTSFNKRLQYQTYDVTEQIRQGPNVAGVVIGDGWYRGYLGFLGQKNLYGKELALLFQLQITYGDGSTQTIHSDNTWKVSTDGPIRKSELYNGERYDARMESEWETPGFNDKEWQPVALVDLTKANLVAQTGEAVTKHEEFKALKLITTPRGEKIIDFGQNLVGWVQLKVRGNSGDSIVVGHAEVLDKNGNFYTDNLRAAKQLNTYILKGKGEEVFEPHFSFQGFRYIRLSSFPGDINPENIMAIALYSGLKETGSLTTSNPLLNQLQHNIQWGQKGNFLDIPTDCPQRDERMGWTGDAQVFFNTAAYNMQVAGFFTKWLQDLKSDQHPNGSVPVVIPDILAPENSGSSGWSDASTIIPWNLYQAYGDRRVLETQYPSMKKWVNFIIASSKNNLWSAGDHYGDWLFYLPDDDRDGRAAITDKFLIAQAFFVYSTQNLINAARVLNNQPDVAKYSIVLSKAKKAFIDEYLTKNGRLVSSSQTAYILALNFDILPVELRKTAAERLVRNILAYGNHLTTGFLGTPYLCHVLSRYGYIDVAYTLLNQDTYPSWLYPVKMGATTVWERWDGIKPDSSFQNINMNSFNHYSYGAIGDWMYRYIAGINPDAEEAGYKKILIKPQPGGGLTSAEGKLETGYGLIRSYWLIKDSAFHIAITIPPNTTATVVLPQAALSTVTGSEGQPEYKYMRNLKRNGDDLQFSMGSGTQIFHYKFIPKAPVRLPSVRKDLDFF